MKKLLLFSLLPFAVVAQEGRFEFHTLNWEQRIYMASQLDTQSNAHTSVWPQRQSDFKFEGPQRRALYGISEDMPRGNAYNWARRKAFYQDFIDVQHEDYAFHVNAVLNTTLGFDRELGDNGDYTFMNTRGVTVDGRIGKNFTFFTNFLEQQAFFPHYQTEYFRRKGSSMGWVMHRGFGDRGFDFPYSIGQIAYTPNKFFNFSAGHGNHFFGEGYRSMFLSDHTAPYGFVRIETNVWKIRYINLYTLMNDINRDHMVNGVYAKKFTSFHYLSCNVTKRWNVNFFESIVIGPDTTGVRAGFDWNFANPVILYRALEANRGFEIGNAMVGLGTSYRIYKGLKLYAQLAIDDFMLEGFKQIGEWHWHNFHSWQIGAKMPDALGVKNLYLLTEVNQARPFMYTHRSTFTNYEHQGLPLAHPWETNFREFVLMGMYQMGRWEVMGRLNMGIRGMDTAGVNMGSDIRRSYQDRPDFDLGHFVGGPVGRNVFHLTAGLAYVLQPISNTRLELRYIHRRETFTAEPGEVKANLTPFNAGWISFGLRTALFWGYEDF